MIHAAERLLRAFRVQWRFPLILALMLCCVVFLPVDHRRVDFAAAEGKSLIRFSNIERGSRFGAIRTALAEPAKFDAVLAENKDPKAKSLSAEELQVVKS